MHLHDYLRSKGLTNKQFAKMSDLHEMSISRYVAGKSIPSLKSMTLILKATRGAVTANDFYGISSKSPSVKKPRKTALSPKSRSCRRGLDSPKPVSLQGPGAADDDWPPLPPADTA